MFCFSTEKLSKDEMKGKYGGVFGEYVDNEDKFNITMCQAPCKEPLCWLGTMSCFPCAQILTRKNALNHINPGSGWSNYSCCQGQFGGFCCLQPGSMGEKTCPLPCMCLEATLCPGMAVSATSILIRDRYSLGLDEDDVRLIRCNNCLFTFTMIANILSCFCDWEGEEACISAINCISETVFCCTSGCMTAQVHREIKLREKGDAPTTPVMMR